MGITMKDKELLDKRIEKIKGMVKERRKDTKVLLKEMHELLNESPGKTIQEKRRFVTGRFKSEGESYYKYLRKIIRAVGLEVEIGLPPGTLTEYQARELLTLKKPSLRRKAYNRAVELAGLNILNAGHIGQALEEITDEEIAKIEASENESETTTLPGNKAKSGKKSHAGAKKNTSKKPNPDADWLSDDENSPSSEETAQEIFKGIESYLKTETDNILLIRVLKASKNFWKICKKLESLGLTSNNTKALISLVDPDEKFQKIIGAKRKNKTKSGSQNHHSKRTRKPEPQGPQKTLF